MNMRARRSRGNRTLKSAISSTIGRRRLRRVLAGFTAGAVLAVGAATLPAQAVTLSGFEIDGDIAASAGQDWSNIGVTPYNDHIGNADVTTYNQTSKESDDPSTWNLGNNGSAAGKVDIGYHASYLSKDSSSGHWWWFAAWDRSDNTGSGGFLLEMNQSSVGPTAREVGDVRIVVDVTTGGGVVFGSAREWNGSAWDTTLPSAAFVSGTNADAISATSPWNDSPVASGGQIGAKLFGEIGVDLTAAGLIDDSNPCDITTISSWQLRGATGNSTSDGAPENLADGTAVHPFDSPITCGALTWTKHEGTASGPLVGGATFTVHRTDAASTDLVVVDNGTGDADPVAGQVLVNDLLPGTYTVTETAPPVGYLNAGITFTGQTVGIGQTTAVGAFVNNLGAVTFAKATAGHLDQLVGGATFTITALDGDATLAPWNLDSSPLVIADNDTQDLNKADGLFRISGLPTGEYSVVETGRPTGYDLDATVGYFFISSTTDAHVYASREPAPEDDAYTFVNTPRSTTLRIVKRDYFSAEFLDGAQFIICRDDLTTLGFDPAVDCAAGQQVGTVTTGSAGPGAAELGGLEFGDYWVWESVAPVGYDLATPQYWPVSITVANDGALVTLPITNEPAYGSIHWNKRALTADGQLLGGATFVVHRNDSPQPDITVVDNGANDSDPVAGQVRVDNLHVGNYQITETVLPVGYMFGWSHLGVTVIGGADTYIGNIINFLGTLEWSKSIAGKPGSRLAGATFTVTAVGGDATEVPWNLDSNPIVVVDNGANDANPADGEFRLTGLPTGDYTVVETGRPTGYNLDPNIGYATIPNYSAGPLAVYSTPEPDYAAPVYVFADQPRTSTVRVVKSDASTQDLLDAAVFLLCNDDPTTPSFDPTIDCAEANRLATLITGSAGAGVAEAAGLTFGDYWLWETQAPTGYDIADPDFWSVAITAENDGALITLDIRNAMTYGSLSWLKRAESAEGPLLAGATFLVHRTDAAAADITVTDNAVGDGDPVAGQLRIDSLHMGTYTITEVTPPAGYIAGAPHTSIMVAAAQDNSGGTFVNRLGAIQWRKTSVTDPAIGVGGATFTVAAVDGAAAQAPWNLDETPIVVADNGIYDQDPNEGGFLLEGLPTGNYSVRETGRPMGYDLDPTIAYATVSSVTAAEVFTSQEPGESDQPYVFADRARQASVRIVKTDARTQQPLDGAAFQVCRDSEVSEEFDPGVDCAVSQVVATVVTGSGDVPGEAQVSGLDFGTYWVFELAAPDGYDTSDPSAQVIHVSQETDGGTITVEFANPQKPMSVQFFKADTETGEGLAGATFMFYVSDGEGWEYIGSCTTMADDTATGDDESGLCDTTFGPLFFGDYKVVETVAPTGYQLPMQPFFFNLGPDEAEMGDLIVEVDNDLIGLPVPGLVKTANPPSGSTVAAGDTITYTLTLTNTGTAPAVGDIVDTLPSQVSITSAGSGSASIDGRTITWSQVTVPVGESVTLTYSVTVNADAPLGAFSNTAVWTVGVSTYSGATTHIVVGGGGGGGGGELPMTGETAGLTSMVMLVGMLGGVGVLARVTRKRPRRR